MSLSTRNQTVITCCAAAGGTGSAAVAMSAVAAKSKAGKAAVAAGGVLVASYGVYYLSNISQVKQLEKEQTALSTKQFVAKGRIQHAESDITESDTLIKVLQQQTEVDSKAISEVTQQLDAAKLKVQQLEAQQQQKESDLQRAKDDIVKAHNKREQAKTDIERFRKEAALAEKALAALQDQVVQARKQFNPLNHPRVRELYSKSGR